MDNDTLWLDMIATRLAPNLRPKPWPTPGAMAQELDRRTIQTPALDLIDQHLVDIAEGRTQRLIVNIGPQEGKSERISRRFPLWLLHRNPNLRIGIVSFGKNVARRFGRRIRDDLRANPDLGLTLSESSQRQDEFELLGYDGGVVCVGVDGDLTSRPIDCLIIDDPYKNATDADSKAWAKTVREFWSETALARLAPGAPVVLVQTRWRDEDLAGWLAKQQPDLWTVLRIPAQADHRPEEGETDPLGRAPGEWLVSARGRSEEDWEQRRVEVGARAWQAQYQGRPSKEQGTFFQRENWRYYDRPLWLVRDDGARIVSGFDALLISWDLAFKDTDGSDYVAGQVWGRRGADVFLLDRVHGRFDFPETCRQVQMLAARWPQALLKLIEDKANGPAVIAQLGRTVPGIVPVEPDGGKTARAAAVSPTQESKNVWLPAPELAPWVGEFVDECAGFPNAPNDDDVDAFTQALNRLVVQPLVSGEMFTEDDLFEELAEFRITAY